MWAVLHRMTFPCDHSCERGVKYLPTVKCNVTAFSYSSDFLQQIKSFRKIPHHGQVVLSDLFSGASKIRTFCEEKE